MAEDCEGLIRLLEQLVCRCCVALDGCWGVWTKSANTVGIADGYLVPLRASAVLVTMLDAGLERASDGL